jgi:hypothetical protein
LFDGNKESSFAFSLFSSLWSSVIPIVMEYNLVEIWLRRDPVRWIAGALAGLIAGAIALGLAMIMASAFGMEFWFPIKLIGTIALGPSATEIGANFSGIIAGALIFEFFCMLLGAIYAHFTGTNSVKPLLAMGLVWGTFSWIFIWNLFMQSIKSINAAKLPSGAILPICWTFGLSLACVSFFDRMMRSKRA